MIDHYTLLVRDYAKSKAFYLEALAPIGYEQVMELTRNEVPSLSCEATVGIGPEGKPVLWLVQSDSVGPTHIAFRAPTREAVDAFYAAAIKAGASDNGGPGERPHYHPGYYGAFVIDPDGYNIEAVHHG